VLQILDKLKSTVGLLVYWYILPGYYIEHLNHIIISPRNLLYFNVGRFKRLNLASYKSTSSVIVKPFWSLSSVLLQFFRNPFVCREAMRNWRIPGEIFLMSRTNTMYLCAKCTSEVHGYFKTVSSLLSQVVEQRWLQMSTILSPAAYGVWATGSCKLIIVQPLTDAGALIPNCCVPETAASMSTPLLWYASHLKGYNHLSLAKCFVLRCQHIVQTFKKHRVSLQWLCFLLTFTMRTSSLWAFLFSALLRNVYRHRPNS